MTSYAVRARSPLDEIFGKCQGKELSVTAQKKINCPILYLGQKKPFSGRNTVLTNARRWLEYDSVTLAILLFGIGIVMLLALSI
jgi:hypothetical protein